MKLLFSIFSIFLAGSLNAQQLTFEWAKKTSGSGTEQSNDLAIDSIGNVFMVGSFEDTVDFDPGVGIYNLITNNTIYSDAFIQKLDSNGNFVWAKKIGGTFNTSIYSVTLDRNGNIFLAGLFQGTTDFDPGAATFNLTAAGSTCCPYDVFILKLDANGNFIWAKKIGGTDNDFVYSISSDATGNVYYSGYFKGTADFDPGAAVFNLTSAGDFDIFISKLDNNGNFLWAKRVGGTLADQALSSYSDNSGNTYLTGEFFSTTVDFDPGVAIFNLTSTGSGDVFVMKLDANGNFNWARKMGGTGSDKGFSITKDTFGNIYTTGHFTGAVDFDPGPNTFTLTPFGSRDIFIQKLDANGNFIWAKQMGGSGSVGNSRSITTDIFGNIYLTGSFQNTIDFNPGAGIFNLTSAATFDIFIEKLDNNGNFIWAVNLAISSWGQGSTIITNTAGKIYSTGNFSGTGDFDPGIGNYPLVSFGPGTYDSYVQKLSQCIGSSSINITACSNYSWYNQTYFQSGTYTQFRTNASGCDSILTLNLTIRQPTTSTLTQSACSSYTLNGQTYTQSGTYTQTLTNAAGCDSTITLNLTIRQSTSSSLTQSACSNYTLNGQTYTQSGTYTQILTNSTGCDSTIILNLTIRQPSNSSLTQSSCSTYTLNGQTYTQSGTYFQTITNAAGCDSTITLNLTIQQQPSSSSLTQSACSTYTLNGQTYTQSGTYIQTITNAAGCDSTITLYLTIRQPSSSSLTQSACSSYTLNGQTYTQSGTYIQTITNVEGCDSIITLNLNISFPPSSQVTLSGNTLTAVQNGASYQWLDCNNGLSPIAGANAQSYQPTSSGSYAVSVTNGACTETSSCTNLTIVGVNNQNLESIKIYPNPVKNIITLEVDPSYLGMNYRIVDVLGREILNGTINEQINQIKLQDLVPGIYILFGEKESIKYKIVKE